MKVLHVLDTSIPDTAGYTTRGYYLTMNQKKLGWIPVILTSERFNNPNTILEEEIESIKYYRTQKQHGFIRKIPFFAENHEIQTLRRRVSEVASQEKVDIIHAHSPSLIGTACHNYCRKKNIPLVYEIRAFWEDAAVDRGAFTGGSLKYKLRRTHETEVVKKADAVIAICDGIKNDLLARGISTEKIHVVRNGVDAELFRPQEANQQLKDQIKCFGKTIIGFIGSFFNFEGLQVLIAAMVDIVKKDDNIVLLLVGAGQVDEQLRNMVKEFGLENKVVFTGRVPHEQVNDYYSIIDVLVYPRIKRRITELVTPLKPLEAMAMEKPVLMSDVGGLRELVNVDGAVRFFKAEDTEDLAAQCLQLCSNKVQRRVLGKKAREHVTESWNWSMRAEEDLAIYKKLIC